MYSNKSPIPDLRLLYLGRQNKHRHSKVVDVDYILVVIIRFALVLI